MYSTISDGKGLTFLLKKSSGKSLEKSCCSPQRMLITLPVRSVPEPACSNVSYGPLLLSHLGYGKFDKPFFFYF